MAFSSPRRLTAGEVITATVWNESNDELLRELARAKQPRDPVGALIRDRVAEIRRAEKVDKNGDV